MGKFIAGAYQLSYNSKALGQTADGVRMTYELFKRIITGHLAGQTPQDAVYQGQNRTSSFRLIEADEAGIADLLYPYTDTIGNEWQLGKIGLLDVRGQGTNTPTVRAKSLVLTAITGTTAANDAAASMTFPLSILHDRFPVDILLAPDLKEIPIRMQHYVDMDASPQPVFGSST